MAPTRRRSYDVLNRTKRERLEEEDRALERWFHTSDYPLLFWLDRCLEPHSEVFEIGGSAGHFFYSAQRFAPFPESIRWTIAELPEAVELGRELAEGRGEDRLHFVVSGEEPVDGDIVLTAGALQYMDASLDELLRAGRRMPGHLLVHRLPAWGGDTFWTVQHLGSCALPYRITGWPELEGRLTELGYRTVARWHEDRRIEIPWHRDSRPIDRYYGFYMRRG